MTRVVMNPDLDALVAERYLRGAVDRATGRLLDGAQRRAPVVKVWLSARDERVRASHEHADGQAIPENLRFKIRKVGTGDDVDDVRMGYDLAREPRDPNLPIGNRINCRCGAPHIPDLLRNSIRRTQTTVVGTKVKATVYTRFARAAESEYGTDGDVPARFMRDALAVERARWQRR